MLPLLDALLEAPLDALLEPVELAPVEDPLTLVAAELELPVVVLLLLEGVPVVPDVLAEPEALVDRTEEELAPMDCVAWVVAPPLDVARSGKLLSCVHPGPGFAHTYELNEPPLQRKKVS